jgi:hypothetical protein
MSIRSNVLAGILLVLPILGWAQKIPPQKPKLIVGITVSGMQYDYLSVYWDKFGEEGFKKMANTGAHCRNARYEYLITDPSTGFASIATGTKPAAHGIVADYWYDRMSNQVIYSIADESQVTIEGTFGSGAYSPKLLHSRTLADEIRIKSRFKSRSVGVSMDPIGAVMMAGHTASGAYWLDPDQANWISSSFYMDSLPDWVRTFNEKSYPDLYLEQTWETLRPISEYQESVLDNNEYETGFGGQITFPYNLAQISAKSKTEKDYSVLMSTPWGNTFTKDMAIAAIVNEGLGKQEVTDMIHIGFNATRFLAEECPSRPKTIVISSRKVLLGGYGALGFFHSPNSRRSWHAFFL